LTREALVGSWTSRRSGDAHYLLTLNEDGTGTIWVPRGSIGSDQYRIKRWTLQGTTLEVIARRPGATVALAGDACPDALMLTFTTPGGATCPIGFRRLELGPPVCGGRGPLPHTRRRSAPRSGLEGYDPEA
jgi:hypothetical protein